ncbi:MAG: formate dehydrogenase accessory sulfurtransferase FdhD [Dehalococcoidia bacterium]
MRQETARITVTGVTEAERIEKDEILAREHGLTIIINGQELTTLLCSPAKLQYLALGFLLSEGIISVKDEIEKVLLDEEKRSVRIETGEPSPPDRDPVSMRYITSSGGKGINLSSIADNAGKAKMESKTAIALSRVYSLMREFQNRSEVFRETGGVHSAALSDGEEIILFTEDIGRHNAIDKIIGECLWESIQMRDRIMLTSGRVSSEIASKVARQGIPILISRSAPTDMAVRNAGEMGLTLVGFVRGQRMNIYASDWRIID